MNNRKWAYIVLCIFLGGLILGGYSLVVLNKELSRISVIFIVMGLIGYLFVMRNKKREDEAEKAASKQNPPEETNEAESTTNHDNENGLTDEAENKESEK